MRDSDKIIEAQKFFTDVIHPADFAIAMRRYMHEVILLQNNSDLYEIPEPLKDGYFQLMDFVETIDPLLTK